MLVPLFERVQGGRLTVFASALTEAELLVRPLRDRNVDAVQRIGDLLSEPGIHVVEVSRRIARHGARLRSHNSLKLADAIIVATAIETGCEAIVGNDHPWASRLPDVNYYLLDDIVRTA